MKRLLFAFLIMVGCNRADHGHDHGHDPAAEEADTHAVTVWTDRFEVFAEYEAPTAGKSLRFITHVTELRNDQPRSEGRVIMVARFEGEPPVEQAAERPSRPGIYLLELTFPKPGQWRLALRIPDGAGEHPVDLGDIDVRIPGQAHHHHHEEGDEGITFLKEQQWMIGLRSEPAAQRRLVERLRLTGKVAPRPNGKAHVVAPVPGRLLPPGTAPLPGVGDVVKEGQVLARVVPPHSDQSAKLAEADAEEKSAAIAVEQATATVGRLRALVAAEAKAGRELQEAEYALKTALARQQAATAIRTAYQKSGLTLVVHDGREFPAFELKAPIAGTISDAHAVAGEQVSDTESLFTILDPSRVFIEARVPETDLAWVGERRDATFETIDAKGRHVSVLEQGGRLVYFGLEVDASTRTIPLVYEVPNADGRLRIGMALTVHVETAHAEDAVAVPESALVDQDGQKIVFVQTSGESFEKRDVSIGIRDAGRVQIIKGVNAGDRVVVKGAYAVRLASVSTTIPEHGHSH